MLEYKIKLSYGDFEKEITREDKFLIEFALEFLSREIKKGNVKLPRHISDMTINDLHLLYEKINTINGQL